MQRLRGNPAGAGDLCGGGFGMSALDDLFCGLAFFGTGGGGRAAPALEMLRGHFGPSWLPNFVSPDTLPPDTLAAATIVIGGRDPDADFSPEERRALDLPATDIGMAERFAASILAVGAHLGRPVGAVAVVELGAMATAATLIAADRLGIPVLDSDCTGRSIPELGLTKMALAGVGIGPVGLADRFGGQTVLSGLASSGMADRMARQICRAVQGRGLAATVHAAPIARFAQGLVPGSIHQAWSLGTILNSADRVENRLAALARATGGRITARATLRETRWRSREPYAFREFDYIFVNDETGHEIQVFVKNEHHLVREQGRLLASSPDVIAILDASDLTPLVTLGDVVPGQKVIIFTCPALDDCWRRESGKRLLGPRAFGIDADPVLIPRPAGDSKADGAASGPGRSARSGGRTTGAALMP
ncbi:DUF917 domain-containing protein [Paracoccus sp. MBLB3053]|uniref:DUF917 domain-containing protein n=1 Tax=Paracoccus aurantius TaxID=3073814 RepID=A0ABU2HX98_9RHOB|nr:DUF917 domain-containing protein [Paracoccus sp. MBLB3053]MDS9469175.1 DUF917 domain-containing protein [Paracoccus sp. MBLB3053]